MLSRPALALVGIVVAAGCALTACSFEVRDPSQPDLVLLTLDTTRRDRLSLYGYERETTPRLQPLADNGVLFDNAIAVHTNTAPAHASMLTGLYPRAHGVVRNTDGLAEGVETLGQILQRAGYETAAFISGWTLRERTGLSRGFDVYDDMIDDAWRRRAHGTVDRALEWLEDRPGKRPFFLWVHLFDPHYPYNPPEIFSEHFLGEGSEIPELPEHGHGPKTQHPLDAAQIVGLDARYDGAIRFADQHLGRLLGALADQQVAETFIALTADHGETLYEREWTYDHGARVYDEQVRIPLVLCCRLPGQRVSAQVSQVDLMPTFLDAAGLPVPDGIAGRSLLAIAASDPAPRPVFSHARAESERVAELGVALAEEGLIDSVRAPPHKLVVYPTADGGERMQLFDLERDPQEMRDVAAAEPQRLDALRALLEQWRASTAQVSGSAPALSEKDEQALRALGYIE